MAEIIEHAPEIKRRRAVSLVCKRAIAESGLRDAEIASALDSLEHYALVDHASIDAIGRIATCYDDEYFSLSGETNDTSAPGAMAALRKARALSALSFALSGSLQGDREALYEGFTAVDDAADLVQDVLATLS